MIYYRKFAGDYAKATRHLSLAQHGALNLLLDHYYSSERSLPASVDGLCRICSAMTAEEVAAVKSVAEEFFPLANDGHRHNLRADQEIAARIEFRENQSRKGKLGGRPRKQSHEKPDKSHGKAEGMTNGNLNENQTFPRAKAGEKLEESHPSPFPSPSPSPSSTTNEGISPSHRSGAPVAPAGATAKDEAVERIFEHWKTVHQHPRAAFDVKRQRLIRERLKTYTEADLCQAISGYRHSPHHQGQNESGAIYDDIELMLRDAKHVDAGLKLYANPPRTDLSPSTRKNVTAIESWVPPELRNAAG